MSNLLLAPNLCLNWPIRGIKIPEMGGPFPGFSPDVRGSFGTQMEDIRAGINLGPEGIEKRPFGAEKRANHPDS